MPKRIDHTGSPFLLAASDEGARADRHSVVREAGRLDCLLERWEPS